MDFNSFINKDITVHTDAHKFRGVLVDILNITDKTEFVLSFKIGIDEFYIDSSKVMAVTVHGREFGTEE